MKLADFAPMERNYIADLKWYLACLLTFSVVSLMFVFRLLEALDRFHRLRLQAIPPFADLIDNCFDGFFILIPLCVLHISNYYFSHTGSSRSVYLMRRLPDRFSLLRRCITLPLATATLAGLVALALRALYFGIYQLVV